MPNAIIAPKYWVGREVAAAIRTLRAPPRADVAATKKSVIAVAVCIGKNYICFGKDIKH